jgi:hypothetical protein
MTGRRLAIAVGVALAIARVAAAQPAPVLQVSPTTVDAGHIDVIGKPSPPPVTTKTTVIQVANTGGGTLKLLDLQIVDGGTGASADWTVTAGQPCSVAIPPECDVTTDAPIALTVVFDPSVIAVRDATLLIHYTDTADRSIAIPLHGIGDAPTLELLGGARTLDFGTIPASTTASLVVKVTNRGSIPLTDGEAVLAQTGTSFTATPATTPTVFLPTVMPGAGEQAITVNCRSATPGSFTGTLVISADDAPSPLISIPLLCTVGSPAIAATPPAIQLDEVRVGDQVTRAVTIANVGTPSATSINATLDGATSALSVSGAPGSPPVMITITAAPTGEGSLAAQLNVTPTPSTSGALAIAITGDAVVAAYSVPAAISLGTFCTQQPATPRILQLTSTGSATLGLGAPTLAGGDASYTLQLVAPMNVYPTTLAPQGRAIVSVTPQPRDTAGVATDDLVWSTDVAGLETAPTRLTATFVDDGGAIAPESLVFGETPIHLDTQNAQEVTLQNCDVSPLQLDPPQVPPPFTIDSPSFPSMLLPGEIISFSVGFHPTKVGTSTKTLVITSPQLPSKPLSVTMVGLGVASGAGVDAGITPTSSADPPTSFYACSGCSTHDPVSGLVFGLGVACTLIPRRRRAR